MLETPTEKQELVFFLFILMCAAFVINYILKFLQFFTCISVNGPILYLFQQGIMLSGHNTFIIYYDYKITLYCTLFLFFLKMLMVS